VKNNNEAEVEAILDRCPSIYPILIPDHDINLPLHNAVCHASVEILQSLLHTCREGRKRQATAVNGTVQTPLHLAIWCPHRTIERQDNIEVVEALVEAGPEALAIAENQAKTPLHLAIEHDRGLDIIKVLVWGVGAEAGAEALVITSKRPCIWQSCTIVALIFSGRCSNTTQTQSSVPIKKAKHLCTWQLSTDVGLRW
jgi:hypothetical protein